MRENRLVDLIGQRVDDDIVGAAIAVVAGDEVRWSGGFGRIDVDHPRPVTTQTVFSIQSVSKTIVATALMQWIERRNVGLDDPVNRHLDPVCVANDWEEHSPITIRQLLTHTAGLPMSMGWGSGANLEDMVAHDVRTDAQPGTRMIYANWGYDVLGYLLGRLAGTTWPEAVRDTVLEPLCMTATTAASAAPAGVDDGHATGYVVSQLDGSRLQLGPPAWPYHPGPPSGSLDSTVDDLARFLIAHLNGGAGVLSSDTVADMQRLHAPLGSGGGGMGLGFRVDRRGGRPFFCHCGDGIGFTAFIGGHPDESVGVVLLINTGGAQAARSQIVRAALEWALDDAVPSAPSVGAGARPSAGGYQSTYWGLRADIVEREGVPIVATASLIESAGSTGRLTDVGGRWRVDGGMFDGCELDFDGAGDQRRFCGGLYPFEFIADDTPVIVLPTAVDEAGDLTGRWAGTIDTPLGGFPLDLDVDAPDGSVTASVLGTEPVDPVAEIGEGWIRARFEIDAMGFAVTMFARLGLVDGRLEGLLYARYEAGEWVLPVALARTPS